MSDLIEREMLSPYGLSRDEFVRSGLEWLGESLYSQLFGRIADTNLGIELLVAGLDANAQPQLFSVSVRGIATRSVLPYHAIGCGAYLALGTLFQLAHFPGPDLMENVYRACAAKFAAEAVPGVGRQTHALVIDPMFRDWRLIMDVDQLRDLWRTRGQPPFPTAAKRLLGRELKQLGRSASTPRRAARKRHGRTM